MTKHHKNDLNFNRINLHKTNIVAFQLKKDATDWAVRHGWKASDVFPASNRFWSYWTVGLFLNNRTYVRVAEWHGGMVDMVLNPAGAWEKR